MFLKVKKLQLEMLRRINFGTNKDPINDMLRRINVVESEETLT